MNTNNGLPSGWTVMQQPKWKPYALQSLIDTNPTPPRSQSCKSRKRTAAIQTSGIKTNCGR